MIGIGWAGVLVQVAVSGNFFTGDFLLRVGCWPWLCTGSGERAWCGGLLLGLDFRFFIYRKRELCRILNFVFDSQVRESGIG